MSDGKDLNVVAESRSGHKVGWATTESGVQAPAYLRGNDVWLVPPLSPHRSAGEALAVNSAGLTVGYFGVEQGLGGPQDAFVYDRRWLQADELPLPTGFVDSRAVCLNDPDPGVPQLIGGWMRKEGRPLTAMVWRKSGAYWLECRPHDPLQVLTKRPSQVVKILSDGTVEAMLGSYGRVRWKFDQDVGPER